VPKAKLLVTGLLSLLATAMLAIGVAHGAGPYGFEEPALDWLGRSSTIHIWTVVAELLAYPAVFVVLVATLAVGRAKRAAPRVVMYAALAAGALLISEHVVKPLVQRTYYGELTFPSGNVSAVCATAVAVWLALFPLHGRWARYVTLLIGGSWVLLMSLAVTGAHWHTPLDVLGSVLLSVGVVTTGASVLESLGTRGSFIGAEREPQAMKRG
jgi:membrane-associated phospholipid phosphatase